MDIPHFTIGTGYAAYRGPVTDSAVHRHAAFQIARAPDGVELVDAAGIRHRSTVLLVPPAQHHRIRAVTRLETFFVEPHCVFADRLRALCADGITAAPGLQGVGEDEIRAGTSPSADLDPRLLLAMDLLRDNGFPMPELAAAVGLSPQRLRALARAQVGMPLTRWRVWTRLRRAAQQLRSGDSVADAAIAAGFADQAHFTRQLRDMMGMTPAQVQPILCPQSRRAT
ncbi:putative transcriptional regulator, AraC family [Nocardia nova SH22a]|uniref:Putative transcriptional regulator, AraC family n=1 Tax=Nocardia nova SH22a TaxID=1415166 RepID=W5TMP6_9NOCA|nr:AraC family transcriptional regulator [Nocardia nova]AHH20537.1 putative transcriptional regulator, AraC family [Nocardia nova SH22a]